MKMFKNSVVLIFVLLLLCSLFIPVFATDASSSDLEAEDVATDGDETEAEPETEATTGVIESVLINPERVMDYSKKYHLATVELKECANVKWYLLREDGSLFNSGAKNEHHNGALEITWNALDVNGQHPAGAWNKPTELRLSLVIVATGIDGSEDYASGWFTYAWYDSENAPAATTEPAAQSGTTTPQSSDMPHTGL